MEYLFSLILLALNLFNYEHRINGILFLAVGFVLYCGLFYFCYKKSRDFMTTFLMLMCHTWAISWVNVFGAAAENLQITWFYLTGLFAFLYFVGHLNKLRKREVSPYALSLYILLAAVSIYPIIISPSRSVALKEYIMIGFFLVLMLVALVMSETIDESKRRMIVSAYIFAVSVSCALLIFQYVYYMVFGDEIFKYSVGNYGGQLMVSSNLLMEDTSSATIMLATGVFYMLERINKKEKRVFYAFLIVLTVVGMSLTTRRTSILSLAICLVLYVPIVYKGTLKKITMMIIVTAVILVMIAYLAIARSIDSFSLLINSNGRIQNYKESFELFLAHPFGVGFDNDNLSFFFSEVIPHNTVLRWLNMGGFLFAPLMVAIFLYIFYVSYKRGYTDDFWALCCSMLAMNFIPDILNARFFVIPCMLAVMSIPAKKSARSMQPVRNKQLKVSRVNE